MSDDSNVPAKSCPSPAQERASVYQIRIKGHLGAQWSDWFDGLAIRWLVNGDTLLTGPLLDQAALFGVIKKVRDLGMALLAVNCMDAGDEFLDGIQEEL
jgi:hypothetical protein